MASKAQWRKYYRENAKAHGWNFVLWTVVSIVSLILIPVTGGLSLLLEILFAIPILYDLILTGYSVLMYLRYR